MELGISGKKTLVVGASTGIGRAIAEGFAREGSAVTVVARSEDKLLSLVDSMGGESRGHGHVVADLMEPGAPRSTARSLIESRERFDVVVHAVGGPLEIREPLGPREDWQRVWQFNCGIAIEMNESLVPPMVAAGWGRVIHISSISAVMLRGAAPYAAAKAYLNAYTKTIGRALARDGVVVSAILPGAVSFEGSYWDKYVKEKHPRVDDFLRHHQAVGRMGTPEEIASFALLLGSDLATFAQAAVIPVDGGNM